MKMESDRVKKGVERAPHRSLFKALGYSDRELNRPLVGIANSANTIIPGHMHLDKLAEAVKAGVYMAGGTPVEFSTIGVCDGIAMNHEGMKYSLASRERGDCPTRRCSRPRWSCRIPGESARECVRRDKESLPGVRAAEEER